MLQFINRNNNQKGFIAPSFFQTPEWVKNLLSNRRLFSLFQTFLHYKDDIMSFDFDSLTKKSQGKSSKKPSPDFNFGSAPGGTPTAGNSGAAAPSKAPSPPQPQDFQQVSFGDAKKPAGSGGSVYRGTSEIRPASGSSHSTHHSTRGASAGSKSKKTSRPGKGKPLLDNQNIVLMAGCVLVLLVIIFAAFSFTGSGGGGGGAAKGDLSSRQQNLKTQYLEQAMSYNESGQYQKAVAAFKKAYEIQPTDGYAVSQIAILYRTKINDPAQLQYWEEKNRQIVSGAVNQLKGQSADYWDKKNKKK